MLKLLIDIMGFEGLILLGILTVIGVIRKCNMEEYKLN